MSFGFAVAYFDAVEAFAPPETDTRVVARIKIFASMHDDIDNMSVENPIGHNSQKSAQ